MRPRASVIALGIVACLAAAAFAARPLVAARAKGLIEQALSQRTGLTWLVRDGFDIGFDPAPHVLLRDVVANGPGAPSVAIRQVRIACDLGCLFGHAQHVHADAEGLSVVAPLDRRSPTGGAGPGAGTDDDRIAALHIKVEGLEAHLVEPDQALKVVAGSAAVDIDVAGAATGRQVTIDLAGADFTASATLDHGPGAREAAGDTLTVSVKSRTAEAPLLVANGTAALDAHGLRLAVTDGAAEGAPFTGTASLDLASRPTVAIELHLSRLAIADRDHVEAVRRADAGPVVDSEALLDIDPQWLAGFDWSAKVDIADLLVETVGLHDIKAAITLEDRLLDADVGSGALYAGTARARYVLAPGEGGAPRHQLSFSLNHARLGPLLGDLTTVRGVDGTADLRVDMQATGRTTDAVLRSATGRATLSAADGSIDGLDMAGLTIPDADPGRKPFATPFSQLQGTFDIANGQATTGDILLKSTVAVMTGDGLVDLIGRTLDLHLKSRLLSRSGVEGPLAIPVHVAGPWDRPAVTADFSDVAAHPDQALKSLQDLGGSLLGSDSGGLGSLFDALAPQPPPNAKPKRR